MSDATRQPDSLASLEDALADWHLRHFGRTEVDLDATLVKLEEEYRELLGAVAGGDPAHVAEEATDVLFVMMAVTRHFGGTGSLSVAATTKLAEVRERLVRGKRNKTATAGAVGKDAP